MAILPPKKVDSLTDEEDVNANTENLSKLPFDIAGLVEIDTNVEEMKNVQGIFYLNVRSQMFYPSNIYLPSTFQGFAKYTGKHLCWGLFFNKVDS